GTGTEGLRRARARRPDLVLLDIMLPDLTGLEVCRQIKADASLHGVAVVLLTARGEEIDRVVGFEIGADDYVVKPFSVRELMLRIGAILRRARASESSGAAAPMSPRARWIRTCSACGRSWGRSATTSRRSAVSGIASWARSGKRRLEGGADELADLGAGAAGASGHPGEALPDRPRLDHPVRLRRLRLRAGGDRAGRPGAYPRRSDGARPPRRDAGLRRAPRGR